MLQVMKCRKMCNQEFFDEKFELFFIHFQLFHIEVLSKGQILNINANFQCVGNRKIAPCNNIITEQRETKLKTN